jgi:heme exporter protein C
MRKLFVPLFVAAGVIFLTAPIVIARAPFESTMGLVQKIFYFHMPPAMLMLLSAIFCGVMSAVYIAKRDQIYDWIAYAAAELTVLYGAIAMVTGPMWARKAWGVWWQWDARLTMSLLMWMIFVAYLLLRRYGGPGSETLSAGLALFGMAASPFVYLSVNIWRTIHPLTLVVRIHRVPAALHCADGPARARRRAARGARSALSGERRMKRLSPAFLASFFLVVIFRTAVALAQPGQSEFIPMTQVPPSEQLPAAPLVISAYAFVWAAFLVYVWMTWRKLSKVEADIHALSAEMAKKRP